MLTQMYVIYDSKARVYNKPFHQLNDDVALRTARDLVEDPKSEISKSPGDYSLFHIGEYDDSQAKIHLEKQPTLIINFHEIRTNQEENAAAHRAAYEKLQQAKGKSDA